MNKAILIGRLVADPELRYLQNGTAVANFTLAVDRGMSKQKKQEAEAAGQQTADFIRVVAWGKTAENVANYLKKGLQTAVDGRIQTGSYTNDQGQKVYTTEVNANYVEFIEWPDKDQGSGGYNQDTYGGIEGFYPTDNDDIPF